MIDMSDYIAILTFVASVIAIVVAWRVAKSSSKDAQRQINKIQELLDVFVAVQNLNISEVQKKYESELQQVEKELKGLDDLSYERKFLSISSHMELKMQREKELLAKRKEIENNLLSIQNYIKKTRK